jgi:AMMECR1 domain-containing protein
MSISSEADLLGQLRPGVDGLIIVDQNRRALFLPSVWQSIPKPEDFLRHLKQKAGMTVDHCSDTFQAHRFVAEETSSTKLPDPRSI